MPYAYCVLQPPAHPRPDLRSQAEGGIALLSATTDRQCEQNQTYRLPCPYLASSEPSFERTLLSFKEAVEEEIASLVIKDSNLGVHPNVPCLVLFFFFFYFLL